MLILRVCLQITELSPKRRLRNLNAENGRDSLLGDLSKRRHARESGYPVCFNSLEIPGFPLSRA
jgi:hypothetical protein